MNKTCTVCKTVIVLHLQAKDCQYEMLQLIRAQTPILNKSYQMEQKNQHTNLIYLLCIWQELVFVLKLFFSSKTKTNKKTATVETVLKYLNLSLVLLVKVKWIFSAL